jgi:hypothetical protein
MAVTALLPRLQLSATFAGGRPHSGPDGSWLRACATALGAGSHARRAGRLGDERGGLVASPLAHPPETVRRTPSVADRSRRPDP